MDDRRETKEDRGIEIGRKVTGVGRWRGKVKRYREKDKAEEAEIICREERKANDCRAVRSGENQEKTEEKMKRKGNDWGKKQEKERWTGEG